MNVFVCLDIYIYPDLFCDTTLRYYVFRKKRRLLNFFIDFNNCLLISNFLI